MSVLANQLPTTFQVWQRRTLSSEVFRRGVEAIEWTAEERGLAGLSDLAGIAVGDVDGAILRGLGGDAYGRTSHVKSEA